MNNLKNLDDSFQGKNIDLITINESPENIDKDNNNKNIIVY